MDLFEHAKLKGQKLNLSTLLAKPEFKQQYLAPIRVLEEEEQCQLLQKLRDREISLQQLKGEADKVKQIRALHTAFIRLTNTETWEEAKQRFPHFATDEQMNKFMLCDLKKAVPKTFTDFCQRAKDSESVVEEDASESDSYPFSVSIDAVTATVVSSKLTEITGQKIRRSTRIFQGANLTIASVELVSDWVSVYVIV